MERKTLLLVILTLVALWTAANVRYRWRFPAETSVLQARADALRPGVFLEKQPVVIEGPYDGRYTHALWRRSHARPPTADVRDPTHWHVADAAWTRVWHEHPRDPYVVRLVRPPLHLAAPQTPLHAHAGIDMLLRKGQTLMVPFQWAWCVFHPGAGAGDGGAHHPALVEEHHDLSHAIARLFGKRAQCQ